MQARIFPALAALSLLGVMTSVLAGCQAKQSTVFGAAPAAGPIVVVRDLKPAASAPVILQGTMIEKCPVAGCWFMLRDKTGVIKVDTKGAGFVVSNVPLNTEVTVTGTFDGSGERRVVATGMRY
jgi:uncharacterized protein YdeI (BOF family)